MLAGLLLQVKAMVVGRQGAVIGQIGKLARLELDVIFQKTTHLVLQVKVEKKHGQSWAWLCTTTIISWTQTMFERCGIAWCTCALAPVASACSFFVICKLNERHLWTTQTSDECYNLQLSKHYRTASNVSRLVKELIFARPRFKNIYSTIIFLSKYQTMQQKAQKALLCDLLICILSTLSSCFVEWDTMQAEGTFLLSSPALVCVAQQICESLRPQSAAHSS